VPILSITPANLMVGVAEKILSHSSSNFFSGNAHYGVKVG